MKYSLLFTFVILACSNASEDINVVPPAPQKSIISAVDLSTLPFIESKNIDFFNANGLKESILTTLKNNGVNTVRIRIWSNPKTPQSGFDEVSTFAKRIKSLGLKVWLTVHYSDTWADPGHQEPPAAWKNSSFTALKDSVYTYTQKIVSTIKPDYIQIGNEINSGLLHPHGNINTNEAQFLALLSSGIKAVKDHSPQTKIILHFAGIEGTDWFFSKVNNLEYDIIGLSYYPIWHGKDLNKLKNTITNLGDTYKKEVLIAETAYPFTLDWNDWTNNIVGLNEHLILPVYPATPLGQEAFITNLKTMVNATQKGIGFCYWGGELVAFNGKESTNGSPWENQALYDFNNKALPVIKAFKTE